VSKSDLDGEFLLTVVLLDEELALLQQTQLNKQTLPVSCQPRKVPFYYPAKDLLGQENTQLTDLNSLVLYHLIGGFGPPLTGADGLR
jgi:hypothetical protein